MRVTGAYMAGFGTAGSLLGCAAVLFVIATGVVAFQGWPDLANPTSPVPIRLEVPGSSGAGRSAAAPRPAVAHVTLARPVPRTVFVGPVGRALAPVKTVGHRHPRSARPLTAPSSGSTPVVGTGGATGTGGAGVIDLHSTSDTGGVGAASANRALPKPGKVISHQATGAGQTVARTGAGAAALPPGG